MTQSPSDFDAAQLLRLSEEVSRVASSLARLSLGAADRFDRATPVDLSGSHVSQVSVNWIISARRKRARYLGNELFGEPAWDILLDLLRAELAQQRVAVSSLCIAAGVPATTALRYIKTMAARGMIVRRADPHDGRRIFIELSPDVSNALRQYFLDVIQAPKADDKPKQVAGC